MGLSVQEQMLIEQRLTNEAKSVGAAYLLWFFSAILVLTDFISAGPAAVRCS